MSFWAILALVAHFETLKITKKYKNKTKMYETCFFKHIKSIKTLWLMTKTTLFIIVLWFSPKSCTFGPKLPKICFGAKNGLFWHILGQVAHFETPEIHRKHAKKPKMYQKNFFRHIKSVKKLWLIGKTTVFMSFRSTKPGVGFRGP